MLSNKWTFSLTSLVLMLSLVLIAPSAMAQFAINLSIGADEDVSYADGNQVVYGTPGTDSNTIKIMSAKVINSVNDVVIATDDTAVASETALGIDDFTIIAYNEYGGTETAPALNATTGDTGQIRVDGTADGMHFMVDLDAVGPDSDITRVLIVLNKDSVELADPLAEMTDGTRNAAGKNAEASIELHYVSATQGDVDSSDGLDAGRNIPVGEPVVHAIARADGMLACCHGSDF